jgi:hypothetical protein
MSSDPVLVVGATGSLGGKVRAVPGGIARAAGAAVGRFMPIVQDMVAMFRWFDTGRYVADPRRQGQLFGSTSTAEEALARLIGEPRAARS